MRRLFLSASLGVLAASTLALPASADESTPSASESESVAQSDGSNAAPAESAKPRKSSTAIEEITVTARKREENLQETPIAITAFTDEDLKSQGITRINDIEESVPNLQFDQAVGQSNAARIYIRGVGNGDPIATDDPGVGLYVDGVYLPRAQGALLSTADIAQVDVLRGPQGTLFGKNTIGGAVNITTRKPSMDGFSGEGEIRLGNYDTVETKLAVNIPIVPERFASRVSFVTQQRDGFTKNRFLGGDSTLGRRRLLAGRAQFLLMATDTLEFNLSADHSNEPNTPFPGKCKLVGLDPASDTGAGADNIAVAISGAGQAANLGPNGEVGSNIDSSPAGRAIARNSFARACETSSNIGEFKSRIDGKTEDELKTFGTNLTATWSASEAFTFKSISSWRRNETKRAADADLTEFAITQSGRNDNDNQTQDAWSQEFNFSGVAMDNKLKWTTGLYAFSEYNKENDRGQGTPLTNINPAPLLTSEIPVAALRTFLAPRNPALDPDGPGPLLGPGPMLNGIAPASTCPQNLAGTFACFRGVMTGGFTKSTGQSYAAYSQLTYDVSDKLSVTGGLRFTHERKRVARLEQVIDPRFINPDRTFTELGMNSLTNNTITGMNGMFLPGVTADFEKSTRFDKWTPLLNLQYRINDDVNVYATYSRGFKAGLLNGRANEIGLNLEVDNEVLTSYEAGLKSRWFDSRLIVNVAAFSSTYEDIQLTVRAQNMQGMIVGGIDNAGKARINGAELELVALPIAGLQLNGGFGLTAARYVEFDRAGFSNNKLPGTPTYTFNLGAAYTLPVGSLGDLTTRLGYSFAGEKESDVSDPHFNRADKRGLLSGRMSFAMADGKTEIALYGENLTNRVYLANAVRGISSTLLYYGAPRTYGIELSRRF